MKKIILNILLITIIIDFLVSNETLFIDLLKKKC